MLAALLNVPTTTPERDVWSFNHLDHHRLIVNEIFTKFGVVLPVFILDPMPDPKDPAFGVWAYAHQTAHTDFETLLGISGNDLTTVDFDQPDQVADWIRLNFDAHNNAQLILGFPD